MDVDRPSMEVGETPLPVRAATQVPRRRSHLPSQAPAYPPYPPAPPSDWQRYVTAAARHKWIVILVTVLGTAAGFIGTRFLSAHYSASTILWIESGGREPDAEVSPSRGVVESATWVELVTSNAVLDSVVRGLRLYIHTGSPGDRAAFADFHFHQPLRPDEYHLSVSEDGARFELALRDGRVIERGAVGDSIGTALGFEWAPPATALTPGRTLDFEIVAPYDAVSGLASALGVRLDIGSSFLHVDLKGTDPALTTATVNAIADRVVKVAAELKREKLEQLADILEGQYEHAQRSLRSAEGALAQFRTRTASVLQRQPTLASPNVDPRWSDPAYGQAFESRLTLDQLRREREAIRKALQSGPGGERLEALAVIEAVQKSPQLSQALQEATQQEASLRALRYRYTEESAPVREAHMGLDTLEQRTIPRLAQELIADMNRREVSLTPRVDSAFGYLRNVPPMALQEARLSRDVSSAETVFNDVGQRYETTRLTLLSTLPDIRILDRAVEPQRPIMNFAPLVIILSFMGSLGLVVAGVTVKDRVDPRVRYPEQVTDDMRLPILGAVPHVHWAHSRSMTDGIAEVIEALRGLRVRVLHAHGAGSPLTVTVTSPGIGEGKSFVSVNLALSFAYAGYRTLLVDGDVRRGAQHRVLGVPHRPGLTDVLVGDVPAHAAVVKTKYAGLSFISSGSPMHRAPELLLAPTLQQLMDDLRKRFSVIVVDSPPLAAGVDPVVLGTVTGSLLLVLRSGASDLPLTLSKLDVVDALPVRTIGAVLNDVRGSSAFRYYTYDLSGYAHKSGAVAVRDAWPSILGGRS